MPSRILIAEDDNVQGAVLCAALTSRGHEAELVTDGLEAVRRLRSGRYDLALLDYGLPEVDGLATARLMQDLLSEADRPRLVAITAAADRLIEQDDLHGQQSFDAVVSKGDGLPALLEVIDHHLGHAARLRAATLLARHQEHASNEARRRRRRRLAPLAAGPALAMAAAFAAAFYLAWVCLTGVQSAVRSAHHTVALSADAAALVGAVQDAQASGLTYLATGSDAHWHVFEGDAQLVDRLLSGVSSLTVAEPGVLQPGVLPGTPAPETVIAPLLRAFGRQAEAREPARGVATAASVEAARDRISQMRAWADELVTGSQKMVLSALAVVRRNCLAVLAVLACGVAWGLLQAARAVQREWRISAPLLTRQPGDGVLLNVMLPQPGAPQAGLRLLPAKRVRYSSS